MQEIANVVSTIGFPAVIALASFYFFTKFTKEQIDASQKREEVIMSNCREREERFSGQIDRLTETLNSFNVTLTKIDTRLERLEKKQDSTEL